jgi:hypothetical protein
MKKYNSKSFGRTLVFIGALSFLYIVSPSYAYIVTFFGQDFGGENHPARDTARNAFFDALQGAGTENFESFADPYINKEWKPDIPPSRGLLLISAK